MRLSRPLANSLLISAALSLSPPALAQVPSIYMAGDSTTAGSTWSPSQLRYVISPWNEPASAAGLLWGRAYVENHGIGGTTCADWLNSNAAKGVPRAFWQVVQATPAQIISVILGMNDAGYSAAGLPAFQECVENLIATARSVGKFVIVETPNPRTSNVNSPNAGADVQSYAYAAIAAAEAQRVAYVNHWDWLTYHTDWAAHLPDGIHPDDSMYWMKALTFVSVANPLIDALSR